MRTIDADILKDKLDWVIDNPYIESSLGEQIIRTIDNAPTVERPRGEWEYLKEHITDMRDADGKLNQKQTCQFILNLMGVIEKEGDEK